MCLWQSVATEAAERHNSQRVLLALLRCKYLVQLFVALRLQPHCPDSSLLSGPTSSRDWARRSVSHRDSLYGPGKECHGPEEGRLSKVQGLDQVR